MITLITGTPGSGKTLFAVSELLRGYERAGRPIYVLGIPDLKLDHFEMPPVRDWIRMDEVRGWEGGAAETGQEGSAEFRLEPRYNFPADSVIVLDEAQNVFRPRASTSKIPPHVAALETHRHEGIDFLLITQHPKRIDESVRTLVGRHLHVRRVWGLNRAIIYEWDACNSPTQTQTATKRSWPYPKQAFSLYKSAQVHTSRGQRPPLLLWAVVAMAIAFPAGMWWFIDRLGGRVDAAETATAPKPAAQADVSNLANSHPDELPPALRFQPRHPSEPWSAPAYQGMVTVQQAPRLVACIATRTRCTCYTQQATTIQVDDAQCRRYASGEEFDPYASPPVAQVHQGQGQGQPQAQDKPPETPPPVPANWEPRTTS